MKKLLLIALTLISIGVNAQEMFSIYKYKYVDKDFDKGWVDAYGSFVIDRNDFIIKMGNKSTHKFQSNGFDKQEPFAEYETVISGSGYYVMDGEIYEVYATMFFAKEYIAVIIDFGNARIGYLIN